MNPEQIRSKCRLAACAFELFSAPAGADHPIGPVALRELQGPLADWPVRIELLPRFQNKREQDRITTGLKAGAVDIVIGTHKLLQEDVSFKRLGLPRHRRGASLRRAPERTAQALRSQVGILTLTATPIQTTLNLALSAARELSIIATPPARRLAVKTFVNEWGDHLLREAMCGRSRAAARCIPSITRSRPA